MCQKLGKQGKRRLAKEHAKTLKTAHALFGCMHGTGAYDFLLEKGVPIEIAGIAIEMFITEDSGGNSLMSKQWKRG